METIKKLVEKYSEKCEIKNYEILVEESSYQKREMLLGDIDDETGSGVDLMIRFWNNMDEELGLAISDRTPIKIFINSNGGSMIAGFTIIDAIKMSKTPVWTIVTGGAYSCGLLITAAGHKRYSYPNATFLFHEGSIGSNVMDAHKFNNYSDFYRLILAKYKDILIDSTLITPEWYKVHQNDDTWFFCDEAIKLGIIDEVLNNIV